MIFFKHRPEPEPELPRFTWLRLQAKRVAPAPQHSFLPIPSPSLLSPNLLFPFLLLISPQILSTFISFLFPLPPLSLPSLPHLPLPSLISPFPPLSFPSFPYISPFPSLLLLNLPVLSLQSYSDLPEIFTTDSSNF